MSSSSSLGPVGGLFIEEIAKAVSRLILPELKQHLSNAMTAFNDAGTQHTTPEVRFSTTEAATFACVSRKTLAGWVQRGQLPATRPSGTRQYLIKKSDLEQFLAAGTQQPSRRGDEEQRIRKTLGL